MSVVHQSDAMVNERGELTTRFTLDNAGIVYGRMEVESAVRDERGKYVATRVSAPYRGLDRYVGLRSDRWSFEEDQPASIDFIVIDKNGKRGSRRSRFHFDPGEGHHRVAREGRRQRLPYQLSGRMGGSRLLLRHLRRQGTGVHVHALRAWRVQHPGVHQGHEGSRAYDGAVHVGHRQRPRDVERA